MESRYELQRRLVSDPALSKISAVSIDPAAMGGTGLTLKSPPFIRFLTQYVVPALQGISVMVAPNGPMRPTSKSAEDVLRACFDTESLGEHPKALFLDGSAISDSSKESHDVAKQKMLWTDSLKLAGIKEGDTVLKEWQ
jgi:hypothetical protein